eukprot:scaffold190764_cov36-Tisochrysis_lutea.AAC.2
MMHPMFASAVVTKIGMSTGHGSMSCHRAVTSGALCTQSCDQWRTTATSEMDTTTPTAARTTSQVAVKMSQKSAEQHDCLGAAAPLCIHMEKAKPHMRPVTPTATTSCGGARVSAHTSNSPPIICRKRPNIQIGDGHM